MIDKVLSFFNPSNQSHLLDLNFDILNDKKLNDELLSNGYIILPLLNENQVKELKGIYNKWHSNNQPTHFYKSYFSSDQSYINEVEQTVFKFCKPKLKEYFIEFDVFGGMFVVRPSGIEGRIPPHQDWSLVNENKTWSLNTWCPLEDTHIDFSTLQILPGSHRFINSIRGFGIPNYYDHLIPIIEKNFTPLQMKAGEAVFFFHNIVHGSSNNIRREPRVAIGCTVVPPNTQLYYSMIEENSNVLKSYNVDYSFFQDSRYMKGAVPDQNLLYSSQKFHFKPLSKNRFLKKIKNYNQFKTDYKST